MALMTRDVLKDMNNRMLGLGAPVEIDGQGYNKLDYTNMLGFSNKDFSTLTDRQMWFVAVTLGNYKNTQLSEYKADLEETIIHYANAAAAKNKSQVKVVECTDRVIRLSWSFSQHMKNVLQNKLNRKMYAWNKIAGQWVLNVMWDYIDELITEFEIAGFDCVQVKQAVSKHLKGQTSRPSTSAVPDLVLKVTRSSKHPDMLEIASDYDPVLVDVYHSIPNMMWDSRDKVWLLYIETASRLYRAIPDGYDKTSLKPWYDLVMSWKTHHQLVDYTQYKLKFQPYDFQPVDAQRLLKLRIGLNANEVGCGKTFEQVLIGESIPMKKLVICPATLRLNWEQEIKMVNPDARVHIQYNDQPFQVVDGWNIIGYPSLKKFQDQLEVEMFQVVMADEAHYIQAVDSYGYPASQRAKAVLRIAATAQYVFPITGTPKTSRNLNLYNLLRMMRHPLTRGKYAFSDYCKQFCDVQSTQWGLDLSGNSNDQELGRILSERMVRHLKRDVLPHLQKQRQSIPVSVDLRQYFKAIDDYMKARKSSKAEALVALTRAKQVVAIQKAKHTIAFAKELTGSGEKVVITTCFTEVVNQVTQAFKDHCVTKIVGGMSDKQKQDAINAFQHGTAQVMVINYEAGGVGVTLTAASKMLMNDLPWVTGSAIQAEGRIYRSGQTKTVMIYYMTATGCPMDEKLVDTMVSKSQTINTVVDDGLGEELDLRKVIAESL